MESILSAIIAGAVTLIGVLIANGKSQAVTDTKLEEQKITKIAVAAPLPTGEVFTGYFGMDTMDKAMIATNVQADATLDAICANGKRIQQAWEDAAEEDEED